MDGHIGYRRYAAGKGIVTQIAGHKRPTAVHHDVGLPMIPGRVRISTERGRLQCDRCHLTASRFETPAGSNCLCI
jgi:hypothetical protein